MAAMTDADAGVPAAGSGSSLVAPEDRALMEQCLRGDPAAWSAFVERFAALFAFVVDRTASQRRQPLAGADRDDLLADILLEIIHRDAAVLRAFAGRSSLATYLTVVARRVSIRGLARLADARGAHGPADVSGLVQPPRAEAAADHERLEDLLGRLPADEARLVRLHHLEGHSYGEISRLTGMPLGSIGPALSRARQKLKKAGG
jgi:RNA polymerase sigma-70 factor (ECF subfamily)